MSGAEGRANGTRPFRPGFRPGPIPRRCRRVFGVAVLVSLSLVLGGEARPCGITTGTDRFVTVYPDAAPWVAWAGLSGDDNNGDGACWSTIRIMEPDGPVIFGSLSATDIVTTAEVGPSCSSGTQLYLSLVGADGDTSYNIHLNHSCHDRCDPNTQSCFITAANRTFGADVKAFQTSGLLARAVDHDTATVSLHWPTLASGSLVLSELRIYRHTAPFTMAEARAGGASLVATVNASAREAVVPGVGSGNYEAYFLVAGVTADGRHVAKTDVAQVVDCENFAPKVAARRSGAGIDTTYFLTAEGTVDPDGDPLTWQWEVSRKPDGASPLLATAAVESTFVSVDLPGVYEFRITVRDPYDGVSSAGVRYELLEAPSTSCWVPESLVVPMCAGSPIVLGPVDVEPSTFHDDFIATRNMSYPNLFVLRADGGDMQCVSEAPQASYGYYHFGAGDVDADGAIDLVLTTWGSHRPEVYRSTAGACRQDQNVGPLMERILTTYSSTANDYAVAVQDLDLDGRAEIYVTTNHTSCCPYPDVGIWERTESGTWDTWWFPPAQGIQVLPEMWYVRFGRFFDREATWPREIAVGGIDGKLAFSRVDTATRSAVPTGSLPLPAGYQAIVVGDLNRDYVTDVVVTATAGLYVFLSNAQGGYALPFHAWTTENALSQPALTDVDGDGLDDIAFVETLAGVPTLRLLRNTGVPEAPFETGPCSGMTLPAEPGPIPYFMQGSMRNGLYLADGKNDAADALTFFAGSMYSPTAYWLRRSYAPLTARIVSESPERGRVPLSYRARAIGYSPTGRPVTFSWSIPGTAWTGTGERFEPPPLCTGLYTVRMEASDGNGATWVDEVEVFVGPGETSAPTISGPAGICTGSAVELDAGPGWTAYRWSSGETTRVISVSPASTTTYTVEVSDGGPCWIASAPHQVVVTPFPVVAVTGPSAVCAGGSVTLSGGEGFASYLWSPGGETTESITVSPLVATTYTVTVANDGGCSTTSAEWTVAVLGVPAQPLLAAPAVVCASVAGYVASVADAGEGASYAWQITNGEITAGDGTRQVAFTAGRGATVDMSVTVTPPGFCSSPAATASIPVRAVCLAPIFTPIVVGATNVLAGSGFTAGSVIKLFVSTASGPLDTNESGWPPASWTPTTLTWDIPANVTVGQGFATVQVVNTDAAYTSSNLEFQHLYGDAADGLPTIHSINGVGLSVPDPSIPGAHAETVLAAGATVTITGTGFDGPLVNLFTATGNLGPLVPLAGGSATSVQVVIPADAPAGPGTFQVVNSGAGWTLSNAVDAVLGARITVTSVSVAGSTVAVTGEGFCALTVINLFNVQGGVVVNLGGLSGSTPVIPITYVDAQHFTFEIPAGAHAGPAYVMALNPPYIPFTSSGTDPGGAFTIP